MFVEKEKRPEGERHVFDKAADLLEKRGNCRGTFRKNGAMCMWAAVGEAQGDSSAVPAATKVHTKLGLFLDKANPLDWPDARSKICYFNNMHSSEEVVATLRRAAKEVVL